MHAIIRGNCPNLKLCKNYWAMCMIWKCSVPGLQFYPPTSPQVDPRPLARRGFGKHGTNRMT